MNSTKKQLAEMLAELQSRSKAQVILESVFLTLILSFSLVANSITLLVMLLNRRRETIQTIPNMLVASLAVTDLCLGVLVSALAVRTCCPGDLQVAF